MFIMGDGSDAPTSLCYTENISNALPQGGGNVVISLLPQDV